MSDTMIDFTATLARLRAGDADMPWPDRRNLVTRLAEELSGDDAKGPLVELVELLAGDPKWEVRRDVADMLLLLPENDLVRLVARLSEDTNAFVRSAAERPIARHRKGQRQVARACEGQDRFQVQWQSFERLHGKQALARARRIAERQFEHLIGATVHEMRNVLTPLKASVTSLARQLDGAVLDRTPFRRHVTKAQGRLVFLERLLEDLRSFSQPLPTHHRRERLRALIVEAVAMAQDALAAGGRDGRRVKIEIDASEAVTIEVARQHILVAIANVVKNAVEAYATGPKALERGMVWVRAHAVGDECAEIVVEDQGMGISAEDLDELRQFTPGKTTKRNQGTGFGLPIARRNIQAHGGELSIASEEGIGTTVTTMLPLDQEKGGEP
ncbi:MAG: HAMP domain-containing histidine kinase [Pirellulales bacterium]|nr:HAMP domain-containing histidine kinase [Pirellulales bacterium]